jgi:HK97 family phage major capsid protein
MPAPKKLADILDRNLKSDEIRKKMEALNNRAKTEKRNFTEDEQKEWNQYRLEIDALSRENTIDATARDEVSGFYDADTGAYTTLDGGPLPRGFQAHSFGFKKNGYRTSHENLGEFLRDVKFPEERSGMNMSVGSSGGYLIPDQFLDSLLSVEPEKSIVRARSTVLPPGDHPDAKVGVPTLDYDEGGHQGGVRVYWTDEGQELTETDAELQDLVLEPKSVVAFVAITNKLLRNDSGTAHAFLDRTFRDALFDEEDFTFLNGDGAGKPLGVLNSGAAISVTRNTSTSFKFADVAAMLARFKYDSWKSRSTCWVINASVLNELITMVDAGDNRVFVGADPSKGLPANLLGIPVCFTGRTPTLGSRGDVMLCDFSYYIIKTGSGPFVDLVENAYFKKRKSAFVFELNTDGSPWITAPLPSRDGNTYSPFVVLE